MGLPIQRQAVVNRLVRMTEQRVARPVVRLWWWTPGGPYCRRVLRTDLPEFEALLAVEGALGWWVTELEAKVGD
jgi:hypothetical protein